MLCSCQSFKLLGWYSHGIPGWDKVDQLASALLNLSGYSVSNRDADVIKGLYWQSGGLQQAASGVLHMAGSTYPGYIWVH